MRRGILSKILLVQVFFYLFAPNFTLAKNIEDSSLEKKLSETKEVSGKQERSVPETFDLTKKNDPASLPEILTTAAVTNVQDTFVLAPNSVWQTNLEAKADQATGAFVYKYPLFLPSGRQGVGPNLALVYNSQNKEADNLLGLGWQLNLPEILRLNLAGSEKMFNQNDFKSSLSGNLVPVALTDQTHGAYASQTENGEFLQYAYNTDDSWTVINKKGDKFIFGREQSGRKNDGGNINAWYLGRQEDANGNYATYDYFKDNAAVYIKTIDYTGFGQDTGIYQVEFVWQDRPDIVLSYQDGFAVKTKYRLEKINLKINKEIKLTYLLSYAEDAARKTTLLEKIIVQGYENGTIVRQPAIRFDYLQDTTSFISENQNLVLPKPLMSGNRRDTGVRLVDVNGDALTDVVYAESYVSGGVFYSQIYLNDGQGNFVLNNAWQSPVAFLNNGSTDTGARVMDVNGDGYADMVVQNCDNNGNCRENAVYLNNKQGWQQSVSWRLPDLGGIVQNNRDNGVRFVDVNGDGLVDIMQKRCWQENGCFSDSVYLNNGVNGWEKSLDWKIPLTKGFNIGGKDPGVQIADVNNDGLPDFIESNCYALQPLVQNIYLNNGRNGWDKTSQWHMPLSADGAFCLVNNSNMNNFVKVFDINNDGYDDFVLSRQYNGSAGVVKISAVYLNNKVNTWEYAPAAMVPLNFDSSNSNDGAYVIDLDADGAADLVKNNATGGQALYFSQGNENYLLNKIFFGSGAQAEVKYKPASAYRENGQIANKCPVLLSTVAEINLDDGFGTQQKLQYDYSGGYFLSKDNRRIFAGFNKVKVTDAAGDYVVSFYHQGNDNSFEEINDHFSKIGRLYQKEYYDKDNNLYQKEIYHWQTNDVYANSACYFVSVQDKIIADFDPQNKNNYRAKAKTYQYDAQGNLTKEKNWGEVTLDKQGQIIDIGHDLLTTDYNYAKDTQGVLKGFVSSKEVKDFNNQSVFAERYYYDNLALSRADKGRLTKGERYLDTKNTFVTTSQYEYFDNGLLKTSQDALGNSITYAYDVYNMLPATVTNAKGYSQSFQDYDYLSQQPKLIIDQDKQQQKIVLDSFARVAEVWGTDPQTKNSSVLKTKYFYQDKFPIFVQIQNIIDGNLTQKEFSYFDGLGRVIQKKSSADQNGDFITRDFIYDNIGNLSKQSQPYFSQSFQPTSPTTKDYLWVNFAYDALKRLVRQTDASGTQRIIYRPAEQEIIDQANHKKILKYDGFGQLVQTNEYNKGQTITTDYQYAVLNTILGTNYLTLIKDAAGNVRNFSYDSFDRMISSVDWHKISDSTVAVYTYMYDNNNNLITKTLPDSTVIAYKYDALNRIISEDFKADNNMEIIYQYDENKNTYPINIGKLTSVVKDQTSVSYKYDYAGNIRSKTVKDDNINLSYDYTYNIGGLLTQKDYATNVFLYEDNQGVVSQKAASNVSEKYEYNSAGLVNKISTRIRPATTFSAAVSSISYNPLGQIKTAVYANGLQIENTYLEQSLYHLANKKAVKGKVLQNIFYTYDVLGNISSQTDTNDLGTSMTIAYVYDDLSQLVQETSQSIEPSLQYVNQYQYDNIGNLIFSSDTGVYQYGETVGSPYASPYAVTEVNGHEILYDHNGNIVDDGLNQYEYDYNFNLVVSGNKEPVKYYDFDLAKEINLPAGAKVNYYYDYLGQRTSKDNGFLTEYYGDGSQVLLINKQNGLGLKNKIIDNNFLLAETYSNKQKFASLADQTGSVNVILDWDGSVLSQTKYSAFGKMVYNNNIGVDSDKKYGNYFYDQETSLFYGNNRYYNSTLKKWLSIDPVLRENVKNVFPNSFAGNDYAYALNNPVKYMCS